MYSTKDKEGTKMCDLTKISDRTNKLYNELARKVYGTDDEYRYMLGVNGIDEVCFTDWRTHTEVKGNRAVQKAIKEILAK